MDSSLLTAYAKIYDRNIVAYVADVAGYVPSERESAQRICNHLDVELRVVLLPEMIFYGYGLWLFIIVMSLYILSRILPIWL